MSLMRSGIRSPFFIPNLVAGEFRCSCFHSIPHTLLYSSRSPRNGSLISCSLILIPFLSLHSLSSSITQMLMLLWIHDTESQSERKRNLPSPFISSLCLSLSSASRFFPFSSAVCDEYKRVKKKKTRHRLLDDYVTRISHFPVPDTLFLCTTSRSIDPQLSSLSFPSLLPFTYRVIFFLLPFLW